MTTTYTENDISQMAARLQKAEDAIQTVIFGQGRTVRLAMTAILSGGHFLLTGLPGLGKTLLVDTMGRVLGLDSRRIQCTPDLMPADILGSEILGTAGDGSRAFTFLQGPVFSQLLMADEINRASPRTQSALLQAMQEYQVSVGGTTYPLPRPFHVMATQNPIEQEGTYPLPEAQLDRFMLQIIVGYPDAADEKKMLLATTGTELHKPETQFSAEAIIEAQNMVRSLPVGDAVVEGILKLVQAGRPEQTSLPEIRKWVKWGPGPRAAQAFMLTARARALMDGRLTPSLDDIIDLAPAVLSHRMALNFAARAEGRSMQDVIQKICSVIA